MFFNSASLHLPLDDDNMILIIMKNSLSDAEKFLSRFHFSIDFFDPWLFFFFQSSLYRNFK